MKKDISFYMWATMNQSTFNTNEELNKNLNKEPTQALANKISTQREIKYT